MTQNNSKISLKEKLGSVSSLFTVIGALIVLIVFFSITSPYFFNARNFLNIGLYAAIVGCISCSCLLYTSRCV